MTFTFCLTNMPMNFKDDLPMSKMIYVECVEVFQLFSIQLGHIQSLADINLDLHSNTKQTTLLPLGLFSFSHMFSCHHHNPMRLSVRSREMLCVVMQNETKPPINRLLHRTQTHTDNLDSQITRYLHIHSLLSLLVQGISSPCVLPMVPFPSDYFFYKKYWNLCCKSTTLRRSYFPLLLIFHYNQIVSTFMFINHSTLKRSIIYSIYYQFFNLHRI